MLGVRVVGAVLAVVCVLLVSGQPVAAQPAGGVGWVVSQLEREQVVRLPGAVTSADVARLTPRDRVVLAPARGLPDDLEPLWTWADSKGVRLTIVEGWWIAQQRVSVRPERDALPWVLASGDVTPVVVGTAPPVPRRVAATAARLDESRVSRPRDGVRLVTLPVRPNPSTGYATELADRFPGELIVVTYGAWLEFAGPGADRAAYARDTTYGPMLLRRGSTTDLVTTVLDRMHEPPPRPVYAPPQWDRIQTFVYFGLALVIAAVGGWLLIRSRRAAAKGPMRMARAEAYLRIVELEARLADVPDPDLAQRHATARTRFDQARTPEEMTSARKIAEEGLAASQAVARTRARPGARPVGKRRRTGNRQQPAPGPVASNHPVRPRGAGFLAVGIALACAVAYGIWKLELPSDPAEQDQYTAERAAEQLRYTSVYVFPLSLNEESLDVERARKIVGDRPLVVIAGYPTMCTEIALELPDVIVVVVSPDPEHLIVDCARRGSFFDSSLLRDAQDVTAYLPAGRDRTAHVAEYVRAFDARHTAQRRAPSGDDGLGDDLVTVLLLLVSSGLVTIGAIRGRTWQTTNTRLNRVADLITHDDETGRAPHERATTAAEYVHALRDFDTAITKAQRTRVEQRLTALEETAAVRTRTVLSP